MASNIASDGITLDAAFGDDAPMPRKTRSTTPKRQPTFIRAWRKHRKLTQGQVIERLLFMHSLELSVAQLSRIETGKQPYAQDLLEALADVLETTTASLLTRDPDAVPPAWKLMEALNPAQQQQVAEYADFILKKQAGEGDGSA